MNDVRAWHAVREDLGRVADELDAAASELAAPVYLRMAFARLRAALHEQTEDVTRAVGGEIPLDSLEAALDDALTGRSPTHDVLAALSPGVRTEALGLVGRAVSRDATFLPALHAGIALAQTGGRWDEAVNWLTRLAEVTDDSDPLVALAEIHWGRFGRPQEARAYFRNARQRAGDDPALLDRMLKLYLELEDWEPAIAACQALIGQSGRPEMTVTYRLTLGEIHVFGLQEPGAALVHYLDAARSLPTYDLTFTLLQELLDANEWEDLDAHLEALPPERLVELEPSLVVIREAKGDGKKSAAALKMLLRA